MLRELRQARYGYLLSLYILLLCARGYIPTQIVASLTIFAFEYLAHCRGLPVRSIRRLGG
jgi:hypothetical protein